MDKVHNAGDGSERFSSIPFWIIYLLALYWTAGLLDCWNLSLSVYLSVYLSLMLRNDVVSFNKTVCSKGRVRGNRQRSVGPVVIEVDSVGMSP